MIATILHIMMVCTQGSSLLNLKQIFFIWINFHSLTVVFCVSVK